MCWPAALLLCYVVLSRKRWNRIPPFLSLTALWLTAMIVSPTYCKFRYMFSFFATLPFLLPIAVSNDFFKRRADALPFLLFFQRAKSD